MKLNPTWQAIGVLFLVTVFFAIALAMANMFTKDAVAARIETERNAARERLIAMVMQPTTYEETEEEAAEEIEEEADDEEQEEAEEQAEENRAPQPVIYDNIIVNIEEAPTVWVYMLEGEAVAYIVTTTSKGRRGDIEIMVAMDSQFAIAGLEILRHDEAPWISAIIQGEAFTRQFAGKVAPLEVTTNQGSRGANEIIAAAGAVEITRDITEMINHAVAIAWLFSEHLEEIMIEEASEEYEEYI